MIISRTPLRLSLMGGGSDYPQFYLEHGGAVLGTSINHYVFVTLHNGKSWAMFDLPNKSGLGSSSAYTVGLLRVCNMDMQKKMIAELATVWEQDKLGGNVGSQDQYLCSMGGFHHLRFNAHGIRDTVVEPSSLNQYLMLFDTHQYRRAGDIVSHQLAEMKDHIEDLKSISKMSDDGLNALNSQDWQGFSSILQEAWYVKKKLSSYVTTPTIDSIYDTAIKAGASSGKLLGAGGGGFIVFFVEPDKQEDVKKALSDLTYVPFRFETEGTTVVYCDR